MVQFNLHYGQACVIQYRRGIVPVDMQHRPTTPKHNIQFQSHQGMAGEELEADEFGVVTTSDPYSVMVLAHLGYPLHIADGDIDPKPKRQDETKLECAANNLARVPSSQVYQLAATFKIEHGDQRNYQAVFTDVARAIPDPYEWFGVKPSFVYLIDIDEPPDGLVFPRPDLQGDDPFPDALREQPGQMASLIESITGEALTWVSISQYQRAIADGSV